jgi:chromosome segregation protein
LRLTQIKLSGFKSFVEPMVIPVPGQLVGVVGPNGCGKSNVIDAVRWVLGESQAKQLRGETMLDVIFNGSGNRKPVSRASVELMFDNSLARAAGPWSQYAEISVKRVLTRQSESSYFINGTHVRRRDVQDIFLGTGLGPRAYAIIEQGMISRIIEAKPEELRVFLEEAAGVSKYKERRKETQSRLSDTRDNLARVADIVAELHAQLEKLEGQAQVAEYYLRLQPELATTQNLLTFSKKRDADNARDRYGREIEKLGISWKRRPPTCANARLASSLLASNTTPQAMPLHGAQGEHVRRQRGSGAPGTGTAVFCATIGAASKVSWQVSPSNLPRRRPAATARRELDKWQEQLAQAGELVIARGKDVEAARASLPEAEQKVREAQARVADAQRAVAQAEQAQSLEEARESNTLKILSQLEARKGRLNLEKMSLAAPAEGEIERTAAQLGEAQLALTTLEEALGLQEAELPQHEARRAELMRAQQDAAGQFAHLEAQLAALTSQQHRLDNNQKLAAWLARHGLSDNPRLWQEVTVEPGWEDALESVLGARLNAIELPSLETTEQYLSEPPPGTVAFFAPVDGVSEQPAVSGRKPLVELASARNPHAMSFLRAALANVYVLDDVADGLARIRDLPAGALLVTRHGHVYSHAGVLFYGPQSELHGVLQRQREIAELKVRAPEAQQRLDALKLQAAQAAQIMEQGQPKRAGCAPNSASRASGRTRCS